MRSKHVAGPKDLKIASMPRRLNSSKHNNGRVAIIGGSSLFHGAPALCSIAANQTLAALRVGTGYALTYVPKSIVKEVRAVSPNIIVNSLKRDDLSVLDLPLLKKAVLKVDCVILGPGLGKKKTCLLAVNRLIKYLLSTNKRVVIDADAIFGIGSLKLNGNFAITPNQKEFSEFHKKQIDQDDLGARSYAAIKIAKKLDATVVLKGHQTVVTDGKRLKIVNSTSSALATMGTGDVLAGIIGGYAALGNEMFVAGVAGAYLHSRIGDELSREKGSHLLATDLLDEIPKIIKRFDKNVK